MNIYRTSPKQSRERAAREAAEWLQVMRDGPSAAERAAFATWVAASQLHLNELLMAQVVERELAVSGALQALDLDEVLARAASSDNVVALHDVPAPGAASAEEARAGARAPAARRPRRRLRWLAAAAVVVCAGLLGRQLLLAPPTQEYASAIGEERRIALDDGSVVLLAPASQMVVEFSAGARDIQLRRGEATFDVAHDTSRPFRVHAGSNTVQAVGTRFTVNRLPSGTLVAVSEGRVKVMAAREGWLERLWEPEGEVVGAAGGPVESLGKPAALSAGEQARIPQGRQSLVRMPLEKPVETPQGARRLSFRNDTLADIVAEFNRYNQRQIVVGDERALQQRYSGVFNADDTESFLQFLECCSALRVVREDGRVRVAPAAYGRQ